MSVRADQKAYGDVLKLLDHELAAVRRKQERQSPGAARAARSRYAARGYSAPVPDLGRQNLALHPDRLPAPQRVL